MIDSARRFFWRKRWALTSRAHALLGPLPAALLYHRICATGLDPLLLAVSPERFEAQMKLVRERLLPLSAREFAERSISRSLPRGAVCVTFDDGYADNLIQALPILRKYEIPACVFVATGFVESRVEAPWDAVERIIEAIRPGHGSLRLEAPWGGLTLACEDGVSLEGWSLDGVATTRRQQIYLDMLRWIDGRSMQELAPHFARLHDWVGIDPTPREERRFLTRAELVSLGNDDLITLGAHTISHPTLALLGEVDQFKEIAGSRADLERLTGRSPTIFAYPFGTCREYVPASVLAVERAGYHFGYANMPGIPGWVGRFELPRMLVRDWKADEFARRLGLSHTQ